MIIVEENRYCLLETNDAVLNAMVSRQGLFYRMCHPPQFWLITPCILQGCKYRPSPFRDRMLYKATKLSLICLSYLSMLFIGAPFYVLLIFVSGQIVGGMRATAFPFRFWQGNAVPLVYTTAVGGRVGTWSTPPTPRIHSIIS